MDSVMASSSVEDADQTEVIVDFDNNASGEALNLPETIQSERTTTSVGSEIEKFLMRPVNIHTYTWALGGLSTVTINPWFLFF